ncbi:hypothetical protein [Sunxiuqinia sp. sy24]|uniref:hypothetical protein n=1 Tax=Sunxiuqinia sp. sy24 TaxID=3461495 RepID=UPI0040461029
MRKQDLFDQFQLDKMRNDPENYIWGVFYFNRKDYRTILPKRNKLLGWTLNFARVEAYLILLLIVAVSYWVSRF